MTNPTLTLSEAANLARTTPEKLQAALASGDLRDLTVASVRAWSRALAARAVTESIRPGGES